MLQQRTNRPRPVLDFNPVAGTYKVGFNGLLQSIPLSSLVTFTRASGSSVYNSAGILTNITTNVPALDYSPATLAPQGLAIFGQAVNLCLQSGNIQQSAGWQCSCTSAVVGATAPDGTSTATTITIDGSTDAVYPTTPITVVASTVYNFSFFAELGTMLQSEFTFAVYDATNSAFITSTATATLTTTGWTRVNYTFTTPTGCVSVRPYVYRSPGVSGLSGHTLIVWGAQLTASATVFPYIPTTTSSVTRAVDLVNLNNSFFPTLGKTGMTFFADVLWQQPAGGQGQGYIFEIDDGTYNNRCYSVPTGMSNTWVIYSNAILIGNANPSTNYTPGVPIRFGMSCNNGSYAAATNGLTSTGPNALTGKLPLMSYLHFGSSNATGNALLNGWLRRLVAYSYAMPLQQLKFLSTPGSVLP